MTVVPPETRSYPYPSTGIYLAVNKADKVRYCWIIVMDKMVLMSPSWSSILQPINFIYNFITRPDQTFPVTSGDCELYTEKEAAALLTLEKL